ncbi:MAG: replication-associated recombination protein A, partial [Nannocystaceae bacterium]|nr:replication-associated recombination protein A [Nannocystaceae bacterium]
MAPAHPRDLFEARASHDPAATPLAERMRPRTLDAFVGQTHLLGEGRVLQRLIAADRVPSMILWGPPGTGKTTLARIIAEQTGAAFETLSAVSAGVKDIRAIVEAAKSRRNYETRATLLFIDEIHRFNKLQQDALLPHVEAGVCRLIGATTENPSFEVNAALLSRARVFPLKSLSVLDMTAVLTRALSDVAHGLGSMQLTAEDGLLGALARAAQGDARRALSMLETMADLIPPGESVLTRVLATEALAGTPLRYDKDGEEHYNVVSAFIKSMRASDPDASVYWLTRMLEAGEDPMFVARRIVIFASEDIGNADPQALSVATSAAAALHLVGMPEAALSLSQATLYLALAPKSNAALACWTAARKDVRRLGTLPVPLVVRNAVTGLMKSMDYGAGYRYPHSEGEGVVAGGVSYLPEVLLAMRARGEADDYPIAGPRGWESGAWKRIQQLRNAPSEET